MSPKYIDTHCHLQLEQYADDREEVIARMREEGVAGIVVGVDEASSREAVALAERHEHLFAAVGIHPECTGSFDEGRTMPAIRELAAHPKVVAIGECGLEYFPAGASAEEKCAQRDLFNKHIALAALLEKPLTIHARSSEGTVDACQDVIASLREAKRAYPNLCGDMHFFAGGVGEMRELVALGFTVSFTAVITFARAYDAVVRATPLASVLSETDAPYVAPAGRRGERNDPLAVIDVVAKIAEIRGEELEAVRAALLANAARIFALQAA